VDKKNILYVGLGGAGKNVVKMAFPDKLNKENILLINTDKKALEDERNIPTLIKSKEQENRRNRTYLIFITRKIKLLLKERKLSAVNQVSM